MAGLSGNGSRAMDQGSCQRDVHVIAAMGLEWQRRADQKAPRADARRPL